MAKFVKAFLLVLAVLVIVGGAAFAWTQHRIGASLESAARELPQVIEYVGDVSAVESIRLSQYAANCPTEDACERYISRVVGSKGALLMAADVAPGAARNDEVSRISLCAEDGSLIDRMGDVAEIASGSYCQ